MAMPEEMMGDEGSEPEGKEPLGDFDREAADVFDDSLPIESRSMALKEAIKLCMKEDYSGGSSEGPPPGGKSKSGLALILGVPPKKK